jgi:hypothetical protein
MPLGMPKSWQKKINDESNKNAVRIGANIKLPTKVSREKGMPQHRSIGREINEIKSCRCTKEIRFFLNE